ncbi:nicotinate-nicotinamide nucleotide adenylyltransferase [Psychrobacter faecalis]|jgi:nicotinate-nucleotide adenylyltransferase|uniref:nicotinate-nicotinamide nucleotide adenylyltransferase n=1 Tax=Psychrobacter faecalis TaxID=180588 RepID=UPI00191851BB|nr:MULTISPECIES: nicotinate-nicotinamide nucleotide adenylyltransferase [Psychrobacter]MCG3860395.1 nicotinate-nicotinamide nucleotide adenylyltransferase [Psychrobacter sp. Ps5]
MPYSKDYHLTKNAKPAIRAYLGGSFDPVHNGHLQMALYVYQSLLPIAEQQQRELQVSLLPNARSPFKADSTDPKHRLAMLKLAIKDTPLQINELELWQTPPVYTIDSVKTLRARYPHDSLIFIMGMDSAQSLDKWKDGLALTDYVNLWVFNRLSIGENNPINNNTNADTNKKLVNTDLIASNFTALQSQLPIAMQHLITDSAIDLVATALKSLTASSNLKNAAQGRIYIDPRPVAAISSTQVRQKLRKQCPQNATLQPINAIINPTVPNSFAKWLNPAVYQYIIDHQLYSAAQFR